MTTASTASGGWDHSKTNPGIAFTIAVLWNIADISVSRDSIPESWSRGERAKKTGTVWYAATTRSDTYRTRTKLEDSVIRLESQ